MKLLQHLSALCFLAHLLVYASPVDDRRSAPEPVASHMPLARRQMSGRQTRHLRPDGFLAKRDGPDQGGIASFSGDPQPIRGALGDTFLSASNHAIDEQNVDNLAVPPTDAGMHVRPYRQSYFADLVDTGTIPNLKWSMSLSHTKLVNVRSVRYLRKLLHSVSPHTGRLGTRTDHHGSSTL